MSAEPTSAEMQRVVREASRTVAQEHSNMPLRCERGALPRGLVGVLYRNGPGRLERGGQAYGHPFDGDGHVVRLSFEGGRVRYTNRFVRTRALVAEEAAGRLLFRGLGTNLPGGLPANFLRLRIKNAANTNVVRHGGRLLALWEGGLPHRLDPETLETLGLEDFGGRLHNPFTPLERILVPELPFSAHPCLDEGTGDFYNFGLLLGWQSRLMLYRLGADGVLAEPRVHELDRLSFIHSFQLTRRYLVFLLPHVDYDLPRSMLGLATLAASLRIDTDRPMGALLIPRDGGPARTIEGPPGFVFHIAHGFDREDGAVELNAVRFRDYPPVDRPEILLASDNPCAPPRLERLTLHPLAGTWESHPLSPCPAELPRVFPGGFGRPRRYIYSVGAPEGRKAFYLSCIQRVDTQTGETIQREFGLDLPGEPVPVQDGPSESGWLLTLVYRAEARRTDLVVLRSEDLGIEAVLPLPHAVPPGFHGSWVDAGAA